MPIYQTTPILNVFSTAADLDAKNMQNKATRGMMEQYADDPATQFIAMHPEASQAIIAHTRFQAIKPLFQKAINDQKKGLSAAAANPDDPMQQEIVNSVMPQTASKDGLGANPNTNLPTSDVNQPTLEVNATSSDGSFGSFEGQNSQDDSLTTEPEANSDTETPVAFQRKDILADTDAEIRSAQQKAIDATNEAQKAKGREAFGIPYINANGELSNSDSLEKIAQNQRDIAKQKVDFAKIMIENHPQQMKLKADITSDAQILPGLRTASIAATNSIDNWKEAKEIVTKEGTNAGSLNPLKEKIGAAFSSIGIDPNKIGLNSAANLNQINKIMSTSIFDGIKSALQGQRITNSEFNTYEQTLPSINTNTTEGFLKLLDMVSAVKQRDIDYSKMAQQWANKYGATGQLNERDESLDESWNKYMKTHSLVKGLKNNSNSSSNSKTPSVGDVYKGHKFLGGNPSNPASWEAAE